VLLFTFLLSVVAGAYYQELGTMGLLTMAVTVFVTVLMTVFVTVLEHEHETCS